MKDIKDYFVLFICFFNLIFLVACSSPEMESHAQEMKEWKTPNGKVKVLSTIAMIDDLVKQIGNGYVDGITLIQGELDPHSYQIVKGDDEKLSFADIIFSNGLGLEHGPSLQRYLQNNDKAVALGDLILKNNPSLILSYRGQLDPHIWMDISLWERTVPYIVQALIKKDPSHAEQFKHNAEKLLEKMSKTHRHIKEEIGSIPESKRYLVTSHDAFNYFARAYLAKPEEVNIEDWQERFVAPEGLSPEYQLSTTDIQFIIDHVTKYHIHVLFPESNVSKDSIRKIVSAGKEKGLELVIANPCLYADAMGKPGSDGDTYLKMVEHNAHSIVKYLSKEPSYP